MIKKKDREWCPSIGKIAVIKKKHIRCLKCGKRLKVHTIYASTPDINRINEFCNPDIPKFALYCYLKPHKMRK